MYRIGTGYDLHRLSEPGPLLLGGVRIPFEKGLSGHSDADVVAHAITDALFGAAALGDIGRHFPDTDPQYKDANSMELLLTAHVRIQELRYRIVNIDCTVVAEAPKLADHIDAIRESLSTALGLDITAISVKAKTNEGFGAEGRGEAISVQAVVLLHRE